MYYLESISTGKDCYYPNIYYSTIGLFLLRKTAAIRNILLYQIYFYSGRLSFEGCSPGPGWNMPDRLKYYGISQENSGYTPFTLIFLLSFFLWWKVYKQTDQIMTNE